MKKQLIILLLIALLVTNVFVLISCDDGVLTGDVQIVYSNLDRAMAYEVAELGVEIPLDEGVNPYDSNQIVVTATITDANGNSWAVPMFYYEEYQSRLVASREELTKVGEGQFRFRFTPKAGGEYSYHVSIVQNGVLKRFPESGANKFSVTPASKNAFLKVSADNRMLEYDNGQPFVGIGNNFCGWEWAGVDNMGGTYDYENWFYNLADNDANMTQFDLCEGDQLEWTAFDGELEWSDCYDGLGVFNQKVAYKTDYKVNLADRLGLFYRFSLFHWEDFDVETDNFPDWGWKRNPYNSANGGPVDTVAQFFTDATAKSAVKNFLRYVVARWGYSSSLMMYELWNEVDAPDMAWGNGDYGTNKSAITEWHREMSAYIKSIDVHNHLVTTSFAQSSNDNAIWNLQDIDLTTFHRYTMYNGGGREQPYETVKSLQSVFGTRFSTSNKPVVAGEFALSPGGDIQREFDQEGIVFHNSLYSAILSRSLGTAMSWNWGSYVDEYDLYSHYRAVDTFIGDEDLRNATAFSNLDQNAQQGKVWYMGLKTIDTSFLWIKDSMYDYLHTSNGYLPQTIAQGSVTVDGLKQGNYLITVIDTWTNKVISQSTVSSNNQGAVTVSYPTFTKDIAVKVIHESKAYQSENIYNGNDDNGFVPHSSYTVQQGNNLTIYANGYEIGGTSDSGRFAYLTVTGNFTYTARLDKTNYSANGARAGVMVRDSLNTASKMVFVGSYNNGNVLALARKVTGLPATATNYGACSMGVYLRIERVDNVIKTYVSLDGVDFTLLSTENFNSLADTLYVGCIAANKNTLGYNKAIFSNTQLVRG